MSDYARISDAIAFIASQVARQPTLDEIAAHVHLSPFHFQRLFSRWAGVTPKRYLQVLTLERAKAGCTNRAPCWRWPTPWALAAARGSTITSCSLKR